MAPENPTEFKVEDADEKPTDDDDGDELRPDLEDLLDVIDNPDKVKKSFEVKYQNDDDDEIFIVHDEDDEQDSLFVQTPKPLANSEQTTLSPIENPFKDNLAVSEQLPVLQKVEINDDYMNQKSLHQENIMKRKKSRSKNVSITSLDEST